MLPDELLLPLLELLQAHALACLSCASKAACCFAQHEDLWKALVLQAGGALVCSLLLQ